VSRSSDPPDVEGAKSRQALADARQALLNGLKNSAVAICGNVGALRIVTRDPEALDAINDIGLACRRVPAELAAVKADPSGKHFHALANSLNVMSANIWALETWPGMSGQALILLRDMNEAAARAYEQFKTLKSMPER
jgi:hypothetical protein